ncbi:MAG: helix-turn-helix transcriptional regulator [Acidobacteriota bacterium]|jgi:DNA-binding PadR family transcriptional regulator|nr:helix-turn-helix transcriptional regulator [Acidobacteriota bacterium]
MKPDALSKLLPLSETAFYILLCLQEDAHGYAIMQQVSDMTRGRIHLGPGTVYGTLAKMEKEELIRVTAEEKRRKVYVLTAKGRDLLRLEALRLKELVENAARYGRLTK